MARGTLLEGHLLDQDYQTMFSVGDRYIVVDDHYEDTSGLYSVTDSTFSVTPQSDKVTFMERMAGVKNSQCDIMFAQLAQELEARKLREVRRLQHRSSNLQQEYRMMKMAIQKGAIDKKKRDNPSLDTNFEERVLQKAIRFLQSDAKNPCYLDGRLRIPLRVIKKGKEDQVTTSVAKARKALQEMELEKHEKKRNTKTGIDKTNRKEKDREGCMPSDDPATRQGTQNILRIERDDTNLSEHNNMEDAIIPTISIQHEENIHSTVKTDRRGKAPSPGTMSHETYSEHGLSHTDNNQTLHQAAYEKDEEKICNHKGKDTCTPDLITSPGQAENVPNKDESDDPPRQVSSPEDDLELGADYQSGRAQPSLPENKHLKQECGRTPADLEENPQSQMIGKDASQTKEILIIKQRMMKRATHMEKHPVMDTASDDTIQKPLIDVSPYKILLTNNGAQMQYNMNQILTARPQMHPLHYSAGTLDPASLDTSPKTNSSLLPEQKATEDVAEDGESHHFLPLINHGDTTEPLHFKPYGESGDMSRSPEIKRSAHSAQPITGYGDFKNKKINVVSQSSAQKSQTPMSNRSPGPCTISRDVNTKPPEAGKYQRQANHFINQNEPLPDMEGELSNMAVEKMDQGFTKSVRKAEHLGDNMCPSTLRLKGRSMTSVDPQSQLWVASRGTLPRSKSVLLRAKQHRGSKKPPMTQLDLKKERVKLEEKMDKFFASMNKDNYNKGDSLQQKNLETLVPEKGEHENSSQSCSNPADMDVKKVNSDTNEKGADKNDINPTSASGTESGRTVSLTTLTFPGVSRDIQPASQLSRSLSTTSTVSTSGSIFLPAVSGRRGSTGVPYHTAIRSNRHGATFKLQRAVANMIKLSSTSRILECQALRERNQTRHSNMENIPEMQEASGPHDMLNITEI